MDNLSGYWMGELDGTNQGKMILDLAHNGDRVYGEGRFSEPEVGTYVYNIQGVVYEKLVKFLLTPSQQYSKPNLILGNVEAEAKIDRDGNLCGKWKSSIGTGGNFLVSRDNQIENSAQIKNAIFIVHGHDDATKEGVARFVEKLGLEAIILHEQVSKGCTTIIEKFEKYSNMAGFAIALFTPDDVAYPLGEEKQGKARARQNVVLEMGYFAGKLGREKVCVLYKGDVELPSDIVGVVYTKIDSSDAWKLNVAKELKSAGYDIDLNTLIS